MNEVKSLATPLVMPLGPLMIDVTGLSLNDGDIKRLMHTAVGAVILFARNFESRAQVTNLITEIKALRSPALLVAVDQEGGRVQRFKEGFTLLPPAAHFGELWEEDKHTAPMRAFESGKVMARELVEVGVDFSFAPVFDVNSTDNNVIGNRSFHMNPEAAIELLGAYIDGMHAQGMVAIAKHFPGHGGVGGDSHHCLPQDSRCLADVESHDLLPYKALVDELQGVMTAHVLFSECDAEIPTYSTFWLNDVLREKLAFEGVIFSDDLAMQGAIDAQAAAGASSIKSSVNKALDAGCDMALICNREDLVDEVLASFDYVVDPKLSGRLASLAARSS